MAEIQVYPDGTALAHAAARCFVDLAGATVGQKGVFRVALSGGSTPRRMHMLLAEKPLAQQVDWPRVHLFWGDERCVPPDHEDSNYRMARETLLDRVPIPVENVHRIRAEKPPGEAASDYEQTLRAAFGEMPRFDLVLLGMGDDGHTASLFPGTTALDEKTRWTAANWVEKLNTWRITLTPLVLNAAAHVVFLVAGEGKAQPLRGVIQGDYRPYELPAQLVKPDHGSLTWMVDQAAAALL